jgi:uncharacterized protein
MNKLVSRGFSASIMLLLNSIFLLLFSGIASAQSVSVPGLAVTDEEVFLEETQDKLTLYWAGRIAYVKPSKEQISVVVESALSPTEDWQSAPKNRFRFVSEDRIGVNSVYRRAPVASIPLPVSMERNTQSAFTSLFEKDQVIKVKISLTGLGPKLAAQAVPEVNYQLKPLGYALMKAAQAGDLVGMSSLLEKGADPDSADLQGWSALMEASSAGRSDIVKLLLDKGAKANARTKGLAMTLSPNGSPIPAGNTALMAAAYSGRPNIVALLLEKQAQVNGKREDRWTPLMAACLSTSGETVKMLLDAGADQDMVDESGYSPLALAIVNRNRAAVQMLKARGALLAVPW